MAKSSGHFWVLLLGLLVAYDTADHSLLAFQYLTLSGFLLTHWLFLLSVLHGVCFLSQNSILGPLLSYFYSHSLSDLTPCHNFRMELRSISLPRSLSLQIQTFISSYVLGISTSTWTSTSGLNMTKDKPLMSSLSKPTPFPTFCICWWQNHLTQPG